MGIWNKDSERTMVGRFGKDTVLSLAAAEDGVPYVRYVNAYYENGSFNIIIRRRLTSRQ